MAHGAGAPMDSEFMNVLADGLANEKIRVVRFEFPYMAERRVSGKSKPPNSARILQETWHQVIESLGTRNLLIGGKSMGGRVASMVADQAQVSGVVCYGYPFHPPGKPEKLRTEHLAKLKTPALILQGERDTFGNQAEVSEYPLSRKIKVRWIPDGDHSFKPRKASGVTLPENMAVAVEETVKFIHRLLK